MIAAPVAHGGLVGGIVEASIALVVTGVFVAVWLRERSARRSRASAEFTEPDD